MDFAPTGQLESLATMASVRTAEKARWRFTVPLGTDCDDYEPARANTRPAMDGSALNYRSFAVHEDGSCIVGGCTDPYSSAMIGAPLTTMERVSRLSSDAWCDCVPFAAKDDGSCRYVGCLISSAMNAMINRHSFPVRASSLCEVTAPSPPPPSPPPSPPPPSPPPSPPPPLSAAFSTTITATTMLPIRALCVKKGGSEEVAGRWGHTRVGCRVSYNITNPS